MLLVCQHKPNRHQVLYDKVSHPMAQLPHTSISFTLQGSSISKGYTRLLTSTMRGLTMLCRFYIYMPFYTFTLKQGSSISKGYSRLLTSTTRGLMTMLGAVGLPVLLGSLRVLFLGVLACFCYSICFSICLLARTKHLLDLNETDRSSAHTHTHAHTCIHTHTHTTQANPWSSMPNTGWHLHCSCHCL